MDVLPKKQQVKNFVQRVKRDMESGDVYGGVNSSNGSISFIVAYSLFKHDDSYEQGLTKGLQVTYKRNDDGYVEIFLFEEVHFRDAPKTPTGNMSKIKREEVENALKEGDEKAIEIIAEMIDARMYQDLKSVAVQGTFDF